VACCAALRPDTGRTASCSAGSRPAGRRLRLTLCRLHALRLKGLPAHALRLKGLPADALRLKGLPAEGGRVAAAHPPQTRSPTQVENRSSEDTHQRTMETSTDRSTGTAKSNTCSAHRPTRPSSPTVV
jgi:hypothetical protein